MEIKDALSNPVIRRAMRDILARRMIGTYASREQANAARWLVDNGFARYI